MGPKRSGSSRRAKPLDSIFREDGLMNRTPEQEKQMLQALLGDRCDNYGYDWRAFRRISNQRSRARRAIRKQGGVSSDAWNTAPLAHRLDWDTMTYVVGQSSNEEITNLLRQLVNPDALWVS